MKFAKWAATFEREVSRLQVALGLLDWAIAFKVSDGDGSRVASVTMDLDGRTAVFECFRAGHTSEAPERVAFHEIMHVLLYEALELAAKRGDDNHADVQREEHKAIERLCHLVVGPR